MRNSTLVGLFRVMVIVLLGWGSPSAVAVRVPSACNVTVPVTLALAATVWLARSSASVCSVVSHCDSAASIPVVSWTCISRSPPIADAIPPATRPMAPITATAPMAPLLSVGRAANTKPIASTSAAMTANATGPPVFERKSMMRLNENTMMPTPTAAKIGNSSGWAVRLRTMALCP